MQEFARAPALAARLSAAFACLAALGCGPSPQAKEPARAAGTPPAAAVGRRAPPELSERERQFADQLRQHVEELSVKIGERNADKKWELASAADYLAGAFEQAGYSVDRQGYESSNGEIAAQNLAVELHGSVQSDEIVVVGAHYDSARGSAGADDNASGAAAVLVLARAFRRENPGRTLRFVQFTHEKPPFWRSDEMGSLVYAKRAVGNGEKIVGMISIDAIGGREASRADGAGDLSEALVLLGNAESRPLLDQALTTFLKHASVSASGSASGDPERLSCSDQWAFWQVGYPALLVTGAPRLTAAQNVPVDDVDSLDFERMARVVAGLEAVITELVTVAAPTAVTAPPE